MSQVSAQLLEMAISSIAPVGGAQNLEFLACRRIAVVDAVAKLPQPVNDFVDRVVPGPANVVFAGAQDGQQIVYQIANPVAASHPSMLPRPQNPS
ncbi:hypothetical protein [Amycolatopsis pithecellobii]|uniref:Uncharacterized protein n=1 Tax=Amycolatopsis pithecellobii TaxID=664692 RepID=A0A6N7YZ91_9PSEU|nr:hypothetical protein [Amycolatopsis pithecellobii]MTD54223.1 hypothetical protein [Amycolatopsis pithecellobii]